MMRLTEDQQALVERCYLGTQGIRDQFQRRFPGPDYDGCAAERLCGQAHRFDPDRSSWRTWGIRHVRGACLDAYREHEAVPARRRRDKWTRHGRVKRTGTLPKIKSLDLRLVEPVGDDSDTAMVLDREVADDIVHGLDPRSAWIIRENVIGGETVASIAGNLGICPSRVCQIKMKALDVIRQRIEQNGGVL